MRKKLIKTALITLAIALIISIIPVRHEYRDGGSVEYKAIAYSITHYNKIAPENSSQRLNGWRIEILGHVLRDDFKDGQSEFSWEGDAQTTDISEPAETPTVITEVNEPSREELWEEDIRYFAKVYLDKHPLIADTYYFVNRQDLENPVAQLVNENDKYNEELRGQFIDEIENLIARISDLSDTEIAYELQRILALLGDAHSMLTNSDEDFFPIYLELLENNGELGIYAVFLPNEYADYLYCELTAINGVPVWDVIDMLRPYVSSENEYWEYTMIANFSASSLLVRKNLLKIIGVLDETAESAEFELVSADGEKHIIIINPVAWDDYNRADYASVTFGTRDINYYAKTDNYWYEVSDGVLYARILDCQEISGYSFRTYTEEILKEMRNAEVPLKLVVDVRRNTGGSYPLSGFLDFVNYLRNTQNNGIYVMVDNFTFSSAYGIAAYMYTHLDDITIVGTPAGHGGECFGDIRPYTMPNSGLYFYKSEDYWLFIPDYEHDALMPDIIIYQSVDDYSEGIDTVMEAVKTLE